MLVTRFKRAYRLCHSTEAEPRVIRRLAHHKHGAARNRRLEQRGANDPAPESAALMLRMNGDGSQVKPNRPPLSIRRRVTDVVQQIAFALNDPLVGWTPVTGQRTDQARLELARREGQIQELHDGLKVGWDCGAHHGDFDPKGVL